MILKIAADRGPVDHHVHPIGAKMLGRTDARKHQRLRGAEHAACKDDRPASADLSLSAFTAKMRRRGATVFEADPFTDGVGDDVQPPASRAGST